MEESPKVSRWAWLLLLVPLPIPLLPRPVALVALPVCVVAALLGLVVFARKALSPK
jgi:hypothetical protein